MGEKQAITISQQIILHVSLPTINVKLPKEMHVSDRIHRKRQKLLLLSKISFFLTCSEEHHVSLSATEVLIFDISTYPNVCIFEIPKDDSDGVGALEGYLLLYRINQITIYHQPKFRVYSIHHGSVFPPVFF